MNTNATRITDTGHGSRLGSRLGTAIRPSGSVTAWLGCVALRALAAVLLKTVLAVTFVDQSQTGFFEPAGIIAIGALGLLGAWLSTRTGFPDAWDPRISHARRFAIPLLTGAALSTVFLLTALATDLARLREERFGVPSTDVAFPASILVYALGAIASEVIFRLLPIPHLVTTSFTHIAREPGCRQ